MGDTTDAAPNTLQAFEDAVHSGADMIEIDVSVTVDGVAVATHGPHLQEWTDGAGKVHEVHWDIVRELRARIEAHGQVGPERVPSLEAVLGCIDGRLPVNLDIKWPSALDAAVDALGPRAHEQWGVFSGLTPGLVRWALHRRPGIPVLVNLTRFDAFVARSAFLRRRWLTRPSMRRLLRRDEVIALNVNHRLVDQALVQAVHHVGAQVWVYTAPDQATVDKLAAIDVDSITVNKASTFRL